MNKKNVVIVGGGTAGWIACHYALKGANVTLIESNEIPTIGVGEGSTPQFYNFIKDLDIPFDDINSTFKYGVWYKDWYKSDITKYNSWYHPFYYVNKEKYIDTIDNYNYEYLMDTEKLYHKNNQLVGLHFDVNKLLPILKNKAIEKGCNHIISEVIDCQLNENGDIDSVVLKNNKKIKADLFVDCSGFKRVLISKLKHKFIDYSNELICDSAIVTRLDRKNDYNWYWTKAKALSTGWSWDIPLKDKTGTGYVYSSNFISNEDAKKEFNKYLGTDFDFKTIKWKSEAIDKPFIKNCIAIGLSAGFFEPMEASNIYYIEGSSKLLLQYLKKQVSKQEFNQDCQNFTDYISSYIFFHYFLSKRNDSNFWKYITNEVDITDRMKNFINRYIGSLITIGNSNDFNLNKTYENHMNTEKGAASISWLYMFSGFNTKMRG